METTHDGEKAFIEKLSAENKSLKWAIWKLCESIVEDPFFKDDLEIKKLLTRLNSEETTDYIKSIDDINGLFKKILFNLEATMRELEKSRFLQKPHPNPDE